MRCIVCDEPLTSGYFNNNKIPAKLCYRLSCKQAHTIAVRKAREARRAAEQTPEIPHA